MEKDILTQWTSYQMRVAWETLLTGHKNCNASNDEMIVSIGENRTIAFHAMQERDWQ